MLEKQEFNITKRERRGYVIVTLFILAGFLLPKFINYISFAESKPIDSGTIIALNKLVSLDTQAATNGVNSFNQDYNKGSFRDFDHKQFVYDKSEKGELFNFDPNTLNEDGWKKLGLYDNTIKTIMNYRSRGGKFFQPDDIARIYGLSDNMVERLMPFVKIEKQKREFNNNNSINNNIHVEVAVGKNGNNSNFSAPKTYVAPEIDVNTADTTAWKGLPGIGSKLSARIVNYRQKLGGFYDIAQVAETFGLHDSIFQKIKNQLRISQNTFNTININSATLEQLNAHPYINKSFANNIIQYRTQHGSFTNENDLRKLALFKEEVWEKIKPYIVY